MGKEIITILKEIKYNGESVLYTLKRTILKPFFNIKMPYSKKILFDKHTNLGSGSRVYLYDGIMHVGENTTICNYSKFIMGGVT